MRRSLISLGELNELVGKVLVTNRGVGTLLFVDFGGLRKINDSYGHRYGDRLNSMLFESVSMKLRSTDVAAKAGMGKLAIFMEGVIEVKTLEAIAERLISATAGEVEVEHGILASVETAIGFSLSLHGDTPRALLARAQAAAALAKNHGPNRWLSSNEEGLQGLGLDFNRRLERALEDNEFVLLYQPQVDPIGNELVGVEGLIRWKKPDGGYVFPKDFIPIVEQSSWINDIGEWVLEEGISQQARWRKADVNISVSLNVSPRQLAKQNLPRILSGLCEKYDVPPKSIEIEITEGQLLSAVPKALEMLQAIVALGFRLALDDCGTGYSSLQFLTDYPFHIAKLDKNFVQRCHLTPKHAGAVRLFFGAAADHLNVEAAAEGAELPEHIELLKGLGCRRVQGFVYSPPIPAGEVLEWAELAGLIVRRVSKYEAGDKGDRANNAGGGPGDEHQVGS